MSHSKSTANNVSAAGRSASTSGADGHMNAPEISAQVVWNASLQEIKPPQVLVVLVVNPPCEEFPEGRCAFRSNIEGGAGALSGLLYGLAAHVSKRDEMLATKGSGST